MTSSAIVHSRPFERVLVSVRVPIAVKRHHDHGNSYNGKRLTEAHSQSRGLVRYCHGRKQGCMKGRHSAEEVGETSTSCSAGNRKKSECHTEL